jgi:hypothetical protein
MIQSVSPGRGSLKGRTIMRSMDPSSLSTILMKAGLLNDPPIQLTSDTIHHELNEDSVVLAFGLVVYHWPPIQSSADSRRRTSAAR